MTARREVPFAADTLAWVHNELAEIKSRLGLIQQAAEQSRALATDAADKALFARSRVEQLDGQPAILSHIQDEVHVVRDQLVRVQDDVHTLRQDRDEIERRSFSETERVRLDRNEIGRRFGELERLMESWVERVASVEEHGRRNLEASAQMAMRLESIEAATQETGTMQSRTQTTISRIDQEIQRLSAAIPALEREDDVQRERSGSAVEMLRRLESEVELLKVATNRISRLDDRLELVQAERTRHNEWLNEITGEMAKIDDRLNGQSERIALIEVRMGGYQDELRAVNERLLRDREQLAAYLHSLSELESDMRKRTIIALEKEIRDIRGRALVITEE